MSRFVMGGHRAKYSCNDELYAPPRSQPPVRHADQPARHRAEAGQALCPAARTRGAARHRPAVASAGRRHRPAGAAEAERGAARSGRHGRGHGRGTPRPAAEPVAGALPRAGQRRHRHADADVLSRPQGFHREAAADRRDPLRLRHCRVLRRHVADGASRPRGRREGLCRSAAGRAGLSADRRPGARQCPRAPWTARWRACPALPEWQDEAWVSRERFPAFTDALRPPASPGRARDIDPESLAWTRLAYDELLAGQLALALVRAHMRRQSGRGTAERRPAARPRAQGAALYADAFATEGGRRHRQRSRFAAAHAAAAAGRCRLRQDRGGAGWPPPA